MSEDSQLRIVALGNGVWLDEIRKEGFAPIKDIPGGSVTFATLGARLFAPLEPSSIGMVFNAGGDFPSAVIEIFRSWFTSLQVHHYSDKPSARGLVFYEKANGNRKGFQRLSEPLPVTIKDLQGTKMIQSRCFHLFGTAEYIEEQVSDIFRLHRHAEPGHATVSPPLFIWEPQAKSCRQDTIQAHLEAAKLVDTFSPNHEELASFFDEHLPADADKQTIERQARQFVDAGVGPTGAGCMLVRAAGLGCVVMSQGAEPVWLPSFYDGGSHMVVDPTGAGNAFLGAFAIGWQETGSYVEAAKYGQVAASFVIEQVGLPTQFGHGERELWNKRSVRERLAAYQVMLSRTPVDST